MQEWHQEIPELFAGLEQASPGAAMIAGYQHQRIKYENLSQAVIREHDLMRFLSDGEWCEGVRALLIDRTKSAMAVQSVDDVTSDWIQSIFAPMNWTAHPLVADCLQKVYHA